MYWWTSLHHHSLATPPPPPSPFSSLSVSACQNVGLFCFSFFPSWLVERSVDLVHGSVFWKMTSWSLLPKFFMNPFGVTFFPEKYLHFGISNHLMSYEAISTIRKCYTLSTGYENFSHFWSSRKYLVWWEAPFGNWQIGSTITQLSAASAKIGGEPQFSSQSALDTETHSFKLLYENLFQYLFSIILICYLTLCA